MPVQNATFGTFADGGDLEFDDIVVGLRNGINTRFNYQGAPGVYLPLLGGTMEGAIDMAGFSITGLPTPSFNTDAVNKLYVDSRTAAVGATGTFIRSNGSFWVASTATIPNTYVLGDMIYASAANVLTALTGNITTAKQYLSQTGTGAASQAPSWATISGSDITGAALTKADDTNVTLSLGGTPATALLRAVSLTLGWTGQLAVSRGGTGNSTFTAYSLICAGTTDTGAFQNVSGVGTASQVLVSNGAAALPSWQSVPGLVPAALTRVDDTNVTLTLGGTPTTSLLQAVSLTLGWSGQLSLARGGSNANLTAVNGGVIYSTATAMAITLAGSSGQLLQSAGAASPVWTTATYPATAGSSGNFMQSNGTNWTSAAPGALTRTDDTNVTLTLGGTPTTALMTAVSMTLGWTGQLSVSRGGTGLASATAYAVLCGGTTSTDPFQSVASVGTSGHVLTSNGAGALPTFQAATGTGTVNSGTANQLAYYAGTGTAVSGLSTTSSAYLISSAGGVPTWVAYGQLPGTTTNDNASAGNDGEYVVSNIGTGSAVGLTSTISANVTSISLTAGDWDVRGFVAGNVGGGTIITSYNYAINTTSATLPTPSDTTPMAFDSSLTGANTTYNRTIPTGRLSLSGTTTVYLVANCTFTVSTLAVYGFISARRIR